MPKAVAILLGDQLFPTPALDALGNMPIIMAEDRELCTRHRFHQHKLVFFLAAMRHRAEQLRKIGWSISYHHLDEGSDLRTHCLAQLRKHSARELVRFEAADPFIDEWFEAIADEAGCTQRFLPNPMFLTSLKDFNDWADDHRLHMADFYRWQRQRLGVLLSADGGPLHGKWSFDSDNRERLDKCVTIPEPPSTRRDTITDAVIELVAREFPDHPGDAHSFNWPVTRRAWLAQLRHFIDVRLATFGTYQDAFTTRSDVVFHSALSPALNCGLILPDECLEAVLEAHDNGGIEYNNIEGFVRQLIGWREFVRGVHARHGSEQASANHYQATNELGESWWTGTTGLTPLDAAIQKTLRLGWSHHIERLMAIGAVMCMAGIRPQAAHDWFMALFIDSADWVMGPNVYGMALRSDGGLMTTKPYICGANYLKKMGAELNADDRDIMDGLYWGFVQQHRDELARNPRLANATRTLERMDPKRLKHITSCARVWIERNCA